MSSKLLRQHFEQSRPPGCKRKGLNRLYAIAESCHELLLENELASTAIDWAEEEEEPYDVSEDEELASEVAKLAVVLTDFADDLAHGALLWNVIEAYNRETYGTPLPSIWKEGDAPLEEMDVRRFHFFLYSIWEFIGPHSYLGPENEHLLELAGDVATLLRLEFQEHTGPWAPAEFLDGPNEHGWQVKRKLVWLATQSYLCSFEVKHYLYVELDRALSAGEDEAGMSFLPMELVDKFVCGVSTVWSGLRASEILVRALSLGPAEAADLAQWRFPLRGCFEVTKSHSTGALVKSIQLRELVTGREFHVWMDLAVRDWPVRVGHYVAGCLNPWKGVWSWSGPQRPLGKIDEKTIQEMKDTWPEDMTKEACRMDPVLQKKISEGAQEIYKKRLQAHGGQFVEYPSIIAYLEADAALSGQAPQEDLNPEDPMLREMANSFPVGIYITPYADPDVIMDYPGIRRLLETPFDELEMEDVASLISFLTSPVHTGRIIRKLMEMHGRETVAAAFLLPDSGKSLDYMIDRRKGRDEPDTIMFVPRDSAA